MSLSWTPIHGLILAGGQSSRMGEDKALLDIAGKPLLRHIIDRMESLGIFAITVAVADSEREARYREALGSFGEPELIRYAHDQFAGCGPLAGLHAGLSSIQAECYVFVLACDMPSLSESLYARMVAASYESDSEVIRTPEQPFHALYHTRAVPKLLRQLEQGELRMMRMLDQLLTKLIEPAALEEEAFRNLNTREAYEQFGRGHEMR
ncbi:molybdenum cofactor guanylyltransferase [Paenibacillus solisilvae]|uniref:Probable molybdenum cofactor guanylyltransferase n=1 Tax=Paenibacillus solisilvae TaxID=2486751 RepID=A0ABW0VQJ4_9BACL